MSIELVLYLSSILIKIHTTCAYIFGVLTLLFVAGLIGVAINWEDVINREVEIDRLGLKKLLPLSIIFLFLVIFTPGERTIYMMLGSHYLRDSKIPFKVEKLINIKLDELLEDKK